MSKELVRKLDSIDQQLVKRKSVFDELDRIIQVGGTWERALETEEFIYFMDFSGDSDDNTSTLMFRKDNMELVCDNYFATNDVVGVVEDKSYTWMSDNMKANYFG